MSVQPIDIGQISWQLIFNRTGEVLPIDQPVGWEGIRIRLKSGKYAREIAFEDEFSLEFSNYQCRKLGYNRLLEEYNLLGFEADVNLEVIVDGVVELVGELQLESIELNDEVQNLKLEIQTFTLRRTIDRLEDKAVDVLSTKTVNGSSISPLNLTSIELKPKEILELSSHEIGDVDGNTWDPWRTTYVAADNVIFVGSFHSYPFGKIKTQQSDETQSYSYFGGGFGSDDDPRLILGNLQLVQGGSIPNAAINIWKQQGLFNYRFENPQNVNINIPNFYTEHFHGESSSGRNFTLAIGIIEWDADFENQQSSRWEIIDAGRDLNGNIASLSGSYNINLTLNQYTTLTFQVSLFYNIRQNLVDYWETNNTEITTQSRDIFPATQVQMARLIDVGRKILENYTDGQANVIAPLFAPNAEFYNYFITNGYFIRGFEDQPFTISWKQWKEFVQNAFNCDVEISGNDVFIGRHEQFYTDNEMLRLPYLPNLENLNIGSDESRHLNAFNLEYENYEDDDKTNTLDAFHTEIQTYIPNKKVGEDLSLEIPFTADAYAIEFARREGIVTEPTTAKPEDDNIYIVDVITVNGTLTNRTNEGFASVQNLFSPESTYNLRLSLKRLMIDHWGHFLSETGRHLNNGNPINSTVVGRVQYFKANGNLITDVNFTTTPPMSFTTFEQIQENGDLTQGMLPNPILSNNVYEFTWGGRLKWNTFLQLIRGITTVRGYITFEREDNTEIKIYPSEGFEYDWELEQLKIKGQVKL